MKRRVVLGLFLSVLSSLAAAEVVVWEGFEGKNDWVTVVWRNTGRARIDVVGDNASEGAKALKVTMVKEKKTDKDKVGISREGFLNLAKASEIAMDAFSDSGDGLAVAIGFDAGDKGDFYESQRKILKKGWNKDMAFDLVGDNFKCQASDWKFSVPIADRNNIRKMHILIYRPSNVIAEETVYLDNIRIKQAEER